MTALMIDRKLETDTKPLKERLNMYDWGCILIAGPTCSGKTTLSRILENFFWEKYTSVTTIREEDYLKDFSKIPKNDKGALTDCLDSFHIEEFKEDVKMYFKNGKAELPMYDLPAGKRMQSKQYVLRGDVTIIEGLHAISLFHKIEGAISIYMTTPLDVCLKRRIERDKKYFRTSDEKTTRYFNDCVIPAYEKEILPQSKRHGVILYGS